MVNKYSERRGQNKTNTFVFYAEPPPILLKYSERRGQWEKISLIIFFTKPRCRLSYLKIVQGECKCKSCLHEFTLVEPPCIK